MAVAMMRTMELQIVTHGSKVVAVSQMNITRSRYC